MHKSVIDFLYSNIRPEDVHGKRILEIGSLSVNGSAREIACQYSPHFYIGIDELAGPGVDLQISGDHLYSVFARESFDLVLCIETLEHAKNWRQLVDQMKYVLRPNGSLILTCRAPGFTYHPSPNDYWRFDIHSIFRAFSDLDIIHIMSDPEFPGVFLKAKKRPSVDLSLIHPEEVEVENANSSIIPL